MYIHLEIQIAKIIGSIPGAAVADQNNTRMGSTLIPNKLKGKVQSARTSQKGSIGIEGVRFFNSLPEKVKKWDGSQEIFTEMLDKFLEKNPDNPVMETLSP